MSRSRASAPALGAAFMSLALLLAPALCSATPTGVPPLSPETRAALAEAAGKSAVLPWQRKFMRGLSGRPSGPAKPTSTTGVDGDWTQELPPTFEEVPALYDPARESMIVFGGRLTGGDFFSNETWELPLSGPLKWTLLATTGPLPAPRAGHALLYDSRRDRLLVFGGADSVTRNDFWVLDLTTNPPTWEQALPTGPLPSRRTYSQAVYDSLNDRVVVFGGADSLDQTNSPIIFRDDLWALPVDSPTQWTELAPAGTPPSPRAGAADVYDKPRQRMVLFGGFDGGPLGDAFTLSLDSSPAWAPLGATGGPPEARAVPTVALDAPQARMVIFGGLSLSGVGDIWALDLVANEWTELIPAGNAPGRRQQAAGIFDEPRKRMLIFGGRGDTTEVTDPLWSLELGDTIQWLVLASKHPSTRWSAASAVDPSRRVMWAHGGTGDNNSGGSPVKSDLWALPLDGSADWDSPGTTGTELGRRSGHSAIYDAPRDRLVFFGGEDDNDALQNDVWALTLSGTPNWSHLTPIGTPPAARKYHSAVYDPVNQRMVVFGGTGASGERHDVWTLSLAGATVWNELLPTGAPPPNLFGQSGALDESGNRLIVYGSVAAPLSDTVYVLTLTGSSAWSRIIPAGTPPQNRVFASLTGIGSRMILHGGSKNSGVTDPLNDTWLLSLYPPSWRQLGVGPRFPPPRMQHIAGFDQLSFALTVFSGQGERTQSDTWSLLLDQAVPALVSLVSANSRPGRVELAWEASSTLESATVQKCTDGATWEALGAVTQDGSGRLTYVDLDVVSGARYGYRLALPGGAMSDAVWVEVPEAARFALRGMTPNPGPAEAALVAFTLPDAAPARLEVMDIAGRQVFAREVGSLGPGQHFVRVSGGAPMTPGIYFVRLTRAGQVLSTKAVTTR